MAVMAVNGGLNPPAASTHRPLAAAARSRCSLASGALLVGGFRWSGAFVGRGLGWSGAFVGLGLCWFGARLVWGSVGLGLGWSGGRLLGVREGQWSGAASACLRCIHSLGVL